jgi:hypothetical protein
MDKLLTIDDMLERFGGTTRGSWAQSRYKGTGPRFLKVGKRVLYRESDVVAFMDAAARTKTGRAV